MWEFVQSIEYRNRLILTKKYCNTACNTLKKTKFYYSKADDAALATHSSWWRAITGVARNFCPQGVRNPPYFFHHNLSNRGGYPASTNPSPFSRQICESHGSLWSWLGGEVRTPRLSWPATPACLLSYSDKSRRRRRRRGSWQWPAGGRITSDDTHVHQYLTGYWSRRRSYNTIIRRGRSASRPVRTNSSSI